MIEAVAHVNWSAYFYWCLLGTLGLIVLLVAVAPLRKRTRIPSNIVQSLIALCFLGALGFGVLGVMSFDKTVVYPSRSVVPLTYSGLDQTVYTVNQQQEDRWVKSEYGLTKSEDSGLIKSLYVDDEGEKYSHCSAEYGKLVQENGKMYVPVSFTCGKTDMEKLKEKAHS